jgi:hypothetical protein
MTDGQRIVLAGAGDQEVSVSLTTQSMTRVHPSSFSLAFLLVMSFSY